MDHETAFNQILEKAKEMQDMCLQYATMYEHIFAKGKGIAWKLLKTTEDREAFIVSPQYTEVNRILRDSINSKG